MYKRVLIGIIIVSALPLFGQRISENPLPNELSEVSGLEVLNDTTLIAINDSENDPIVYLINMDGSLQKKVQILNAKNVDWEDLTRDNTHLYIGDIGNNLNRRKDLCIYKISLDELSHNEQASAQAIFFSYEDQHAFPPPKTEENFDAEGIAWYQNKLWIFSKSSAEPWTGIASIYSLSTEPGTHKAKPYTNIQVGKVGWWEDAITGADIINSSIYLTTYNRIIKLNIANKEINHDVDIIFNEMTQKESIVILNENVLLYADEKQPFIGGGKLYRYIRE